MMTNLLHQLKSNAVVLLGDHEFVDVLLSFDFNFGERLRYLRKAMFDVSIRPRTQVITTLERVNKLK
jgi:hypothetical protein